MSDQIERYGDMAGMVPDEHGQYVLASDYDALRMQCGGMEMTINELQAENQELKHSASRDLAVRLVSQLVHSGAEHYQESTFFLDMQNYAGMEAVVILQRPDQKTPRMLRMDAERKLASCEKDRELWEKRACQEASDAEGLRQTIQDGYAGQGRRLYETCLKAGAQPGNVKQWLDELIAKASAAPEQEVAFELRAVLGGLNGLCWETVKQVELPAPTQHGETFKLYTRPDAEIERLRAENKTLRATGEVMAGAVPVLDDVRQQLAAAQALLRERRETDGAVAYLTPDEKDWATRADASLSTQPAECQEVEDGR